MSYSQQWTKDLQSNRSLYCTGDKKPKKRASRLATGWIICCLTVGTTESRAPRGKLLFIAYSLSITYCQIIIFPLKPVCHLLRHYLKFSYFWKIFKLKLRRTFIWIMFPRSTDCLGAFRALIAQSASKKVVYSVLSWPGRGYRYLNIKMLTLSVPNTT